MMGKGYEPLRADEQEVLNKLVDQHNDLYVEVDQWGYHPNPEIRHGDKRIQIHFPMVFTRPAFWYEVEEFHLKLKTRSGGTLYEETMDVDLPGQDSVWIREGIEMQLVWDLWIERISDDLLNRISPATEGKEVMSVDHKTGEVSKGED